MKLPALLQKIVILLVVSTTLFVTAAPLASAATQELAPIPPVERNYTYNSGPDYSQFNNTGDRAQIAFFEVTGALFCQITGINILNRENPCLTVNVTNGKIEYAQNTDGRVGGLLGQVSMMIGATYDLPIHTSHYTGYLAQNFGLTEKAYAQGTGFEALQPILSLWTRIRDLSYLAFVIMFVLIGFGIMMRVKIDPRTVMAIQNQIPKIIIAILLITFSYAIAGFLIDTMWTATYIGINVLTAEAPCAAGSSETFTAVATSNLLNTPMQYLERLLGDNSCGVSGFGIATLSFNIGQTLGDLLTSIIGAGIFGSGASSADCGIGPGSNFMECINQATEFIFSFIFGIVAWMIIFIAILTQLFRIWFSLLKGYFYVIFYTLVGPIYILFGLIPGSQHFGFEQWLRYMAASLSMFPATAFVFILAVIIANNPAMNNPDAQQFIPPMVGNPKIANNLGMLFALGAILIAPEIINVLRNSFKAPASKYTPQIAKGFASGATPVQGNLGKGWGYMTRASDSTGDNGGFIRQAIIGGAGQYYKPNPLGGRSLDYQKINLRYKLANMLLGK